jgi:hypothetical protein
MRDPGSFTPQSRQVGDAALPGTAIHMGLDLQVKATMMDAMWDFFSRLLDEKLAIAIGNSPCHRG